MIMDLLMVKGYNPRDLPWSYMWFRNFLAVPRFSERDDGADAENDSAHMPQALMKGFRIFGLKGEPSIKGDDWAWCTIQPLPLPRFKNHAANTPWQYLKSPAGIDYPAWFIHGYPVLYLAGCPNCGRQVDFSGFLWRIILVDPSLCIQCYMHPDSQLPTIQKYSGIPHVSLYDGSTWIIYV